VRRSAQDDGFVGGLEIQLVGYAENKKRSKKSQTLRMMILWEFDEKHPKQLSAYGRSAH
jgi:ABC-type sulfate/molybdate transport systems ATPase subunit